MPPYRFLDYLIIGNISEEYIVDLDGIAQNNILGGSALYAAGGLRCWDSRVGLISKAPERLSRELVHQLARLKIDARGIEFFPDSNESDRFIGYINPESFIEKDPVAFYASKNLPFPQSMTSKKKEPYKKNKLIQPDIEKSHPFSIPAEYLNAKAAHICSADLNTQIQFASILQSGSINTLTIEPDDRTMSPATWDSLPVLLTNLTAFIATKTQLESLFRGRSENIWEMATTLCGMGCEYVVINDGLSGQMLFDNNTKKKYQVPAYFARLVDPTGMRDSFCGGFLAGLTKNYDPLEAVLCGNVSSSLTAEGSGPFYCLDSTPGLIESRLGYIREMVKTI